MEEIQIGNIGELIEPDPIGFSFGAPGWTILLIAVTFLLVLYALIRYRRYKKNKYRRIAVDLIDHISETQLPADKYLYQIAKIIKQVAITSYGRADQAQLHGLQWLNYLQQKNKGIPIFSEEIQKVFTHHIYQGRKTEVTEQLINNLKEESTNWIKDHRV